MKKYTPKPVPSPRVFRSIFGPIGRKWLNLHGLEGRFKIAGTPEGESELGGGPKETAPERKKPSGDLNAAPEPPSGDMGDAGRFSRQNPIGTAEEGWEVNDEGEEWKRGREEDEE